ncbi:MAG: glycosyltransferase [Chloroflexi bacterium]|nr:glycosyltransferase [Chloroflexota bacterium]
MPPVLSVVIPTYNRADTLCLVLPALLNQDLDREKYEVLLCDNLSDDDTKQVLKQLNDDRIRHLEGRYSGRADARNAGIKAARGDIILFTDADIIAEPDLLSAHFAAHQKFPDSASVGREIQVNSVEEYNDVKKSKEKGRSLHRETRETLPWLYFLTGNASVPKNRLIEAGMFDDSFTGYGHEDLELGYRLQKLGLKIHYLHNAVNYHLHPVEWEERKKRFFLAGGSTVRFYNKHKDPRIKMLMGWNPAAFAWHRVFKWFPGLLSWFEKKREKSRFSREIVLQYHYLSGIIAGNKNID